MPNSDIQGVPLYQPQNCCNNTIIIIVYLDSVEYIHPQFVVYDAEIQNMKRADFGSIYYIVVAQAWRFPTILFYTQVRKDVHINYAYTVL